MIITVQATGVDLTPALKQYTIDKVQSLEKFYEGIIKAEIEIGMRTHHHQKGKIFFAEVNISAPGQSLRVVKDAEDLYKAIDKVKDHLKVEFEKIKGKRDRVDREVIRAQKEYIARE